MGLYRVGVILSTTFEVEADDAESAEQQALDAAEECYGDLNIEEANFVEEVVEE